MVNIYSIMKQIIFILWAFLPTFESTFATEKYVTQIMDRNLLAQQTKIACYLDDAEIGYLHALQLPFGFAVIHSFYIRPEQRNKGHGSALLSYACQWLKNQGTKGIFVQPGPFELENDKVLYFHDSPSINYAKLHQLINFYTKAGFRNAPKVLSQGAGLLYKLMEIQEDSHYLMLRTI